MNISHQTVLIGAATNLLFSFLLDVKAGLDLDLGALLLRDGR